MKVSYSGTFVVRGIKIHFMPEHPKDLLLHHTLNVKSFHFLQPVGIITNVKAFDLLIDAVELIQVAAG